MAWINILDVFFPVGSLYLSTSSISPSSKIGGTWTQVKGAVLAAYGSNSFANPSKYGGKLTISQSELPKISGSFSLRAMSYNDGNVVKNADGVFSYSNVSNDLFDKITQYDEQSTYGSKITFNLGGGQTSFHITSLVIYGTEQLKFSGDVR